MKTPEKITNDLGGRWFGGYGRCVCPACGGGARSKNLPLSVTMGATGKPILHCFQGCSYRDIASALEGKCAVLKASRSTDDEIREARRAEDERNRKKTEHAKRTWAESIPISGTLAETYLRNRGITIQLPETLRFHSDCWHPTAKRFPALVARVDGSKTFAVHRTYLTEGARKIDSLPQKAMLGRVRGGSVRLAGNPGQTLVLCEGIETGLSLAQILKQRNPQVMACLSTSGMVGVKLPSRPGRLTVAPDGDDAGREAAKTIEQRARKLGWNVSVLPAPNGRDFNDILKGKTK